MIKSDSVIGNETAWSCVTGWQQWSRITSRHLSASYCPVTLSSAWTGLQCDSYLPPASTTHGGFSSFHALHGPYIFTCLAHDEGLSYRECNEWVVCYLVTPVWPWEGHFREGVYFQCSPAAAQCWVHARGDVTVPWHSWPAAAQASCPRNMGMMSG